MVMTFQQPCKERTWHLPRVDLFIRFLPFVAGQYAVVLLLGLW